MNDATAPRAQSSGDTSDRNGQGRSSRPELTSQMHRGSAAYELVFSPVILALVGLFLDRNVFHTTPWITLVLAIVGVAGAATKLVFTYRLDMERVMADRPYIPGERA